MSDLVNNLKLMVEWGPALSLLSQLSAAKDSAQRADMLVKLLQTVAAKTPTQSDDILLKKLDAVLDTPAGADLFDYVVAGLKGLAEMEVKHA